MNNRYVFGPIKSRRLGISLGINLVPLKVCPLDCIYCEVGATNNLTMERKEYVPFNEVISQIDETLKTNPKLDYKTFSGFGEPTLHQDIGKIITHLKTNYPQYKVCLLTNAMLFGNPKLEEEIAPCDLIIPSLDGSNEEEFLTINKPVKEFNFDTFVENLISFTKRATSKVELELFIAPSINDSDESILRFKEIISKLKVSCVQLNTLDRPGVKKDLIPSSKENTLRFINAIEKVCPVEAVGPFRYRTKVANYQEICSTDALNLRDLMGTTPKELDEITTLSNLNKDEVEMLLHQLFKAGLITIEKVNSSTFYTVC
jgi:wyosine [tRNA(Phe)-imidazoG37] synthetase (radical SAM superfamily)